MATDCIVYEEWCPVSPKAIYVQEPQVVDSAGIVKTLKQPTVDPSRCVDCGACEFACRSCNEARRCFHRSGIQAAALAAGAEVILPDPDGYRILLRNGPTGGSLEHVALKQTVIASTDPVALDALVAKAWWNPEPQQLPYLGMAAARGLGTLDFEKLPVFVAENSNQSQRQGLSIKPARTKQAAETLLRA
jgi:ferredoxin